MATEYDPAFFELIAEGARRSAEAVVPVLLEHYRPESVVDVGCGQGWWGREFAERGAVVRGLDGGDVPDPVIPLESCDLRERLPIGTYDLAVCLEVAEHLPPDRGPSFVADLCELAPVVLFSAALPRQGGVAHLNEQWPAYWVALFAAAGFHCSGALRWAIWNDDRVENWYRQNLIVAAREPGALPTIFDTPLAPVWPVIHPVLWESRA